MALGPLSQEPTYTNLLPTDLEEADTKEPFCPGKNFTHYVLGILTYPKLSHFTKAKGRIIPSVAKTSIATRLGSATTTKEVTLPAKYQEFASVFSEEASHVLPPS